MVSEKLVSKVKSEEGFKDIMYKCPADYWTIGYGFNLEKLTMPQEVADLWLGLVLEKLSSQFETYPWFRELDDNRKIAILDMAYQMGPWGLLKFRRMITAASQKNFEKAASEMLDSKWAKQTPNRAMRNAEIMRTGNVI